MKMKRLFKNNLIKKKLFKPWFLIVETGSNR